MTNADRISEVYRGEAGGPETQARSRERVHWLVAHARGRVLDLGCSQGITSILCARAGHEVLGIDREEDRIEYARADLSAKPPEVRERVEFRVGDASALGLPDSSFDTVILGEILEHLPDPAPVLAEAARVAKPAGTLLLTTPFGFHPHHDHRHTFFVGSLIDVISPHITVDDLDIVDGYLRVRARPGAMAAKQAAALVLALQPVLESAMTERQRLDRRSERKRFREARKLRRTLRRTRKQAARARRRELARRRKLRRRLAAFRQSRWTRLGRALAGARTPRGFLALPANGARALRKLPPPQEHRRAPGSGPERRRESKPPALHPRVSTAETITDSDSSLRVAVPEAAPLPSGPIARPELRVATILDRFSAAAFRYEWTQIEVGPEDWRERLETEPPHLLFVESAWKGNDGRWDQALVGRGPAAKPFGELVKWCRERGIPTVFWCKEDPPHFNTFLEAARLFEHVLTTDADRIISYQEAIGNEGVTAMSFGAQPRIHNPVAPPGSRRHPVAFAGTYLRDKHHRRRAQMHVILDPARAFGLHIFTRVPPGEKERFDWPAEYVPHVVGSLPYERMITAYKAYRLFLNVNTVVDSPTMCARRAFEISATGTPVLSGDSMALREVFGDLIAIATDPQETRDQLEQLLGDPELAARRGHAAMRHVLRGHTYGDRVDQILRVAGLDRYLRPPEASISVLLPLDTEQPPERLFEELAAQSRLPSELVLAPTRPGIDTHVTATAARRAGLRQVSMTGPENGLAAALGAAAALATGELLAFVDPGCGYGEHFLTDLAGAFTYTSAEVIGKAAAGPEDTAAEHSYGAALHPSSWLARAAVVREVGFGGREASPQMSFLAGCEASGHRLYCADRFSFEPAGVLSRY